MKKPKRARLSLLENSLAAFCIMALCNCYLLKQGTYVLKYTAQAQRMEKLQKRADTPDEEKRFFSLVKEVRLFAQDSIGLKRNRNFSTYVTIKKNYLVDVVSAAGKTDFSLYQWRFPFFGGFPYKGFFERKDAQKAADALEKKGYDVFIGYVDAFSTLGFFPDPAYSFMKRFSVFRLASLIIHEQTHATIFIKNRIQFNEELATFVGNQGALDFIRTKYGDSSGRYKDALKEMHDADQFVLLVKSLRDRLLPIYTSLRPMEEKLAEKKRMIEQFKDSITQNYDSLFQTPNYRGWSKENINNAFIAIEMTYTLDLVKFRDLYERKNRDLKAAVASLKTLKSRKGDPNEMVGKL